jgi:hypothetical protein
VLVNSYVPFDDWWCSKDSVTLNVQKVTAEIQTKKKNVLTVLLCKIAMFQMDISLIYFLMQGAPSNKMGESYLILLLLQGVLTVNSCIKVRLDLHADKSLVVVKGPFFHRVVNPRYRIRGTMCSAMIQSNKARKAIL